MRSAAVLILALALTGCDDLEEAALGVGGMDAETLQRRMGAGQPTLVLDTRDPASFAAGHIRGAVPLNLGQVDGYVTRARPADGTALVLVCYRGNQSLAAAVAARSRGHRATFSLRGGMTRWRALSLPVEEGPGQPPRPALLRPPVVQVSQLAQVSNVVAAFGFKPAYMLLTLVMILWLRRARARDLVLIRRGLIAFLVGEGLCAVNFLFANNHSDTLEILHGAGMVFMGAYLSWGLYQLLDDRLLRLSDPEARCLVQRVCGRCWKREQVSCGVQRVFLFAAPALAVVALMPLCTPLRSHNYLVPILGTDVPWVWTPQILMVELRLYPALASALMLVTFLALLRGKEHMERAKLPFFVAVGLMTFSAMRYMLMQSYHEAPCWSDFWEETTELLSVLGLGLALWVFRRQLGLPSPARETRRADDDR